MKEWYVETRFEYKGYPCVVIFQRMGHRCGYVGLPKGHKYYGLEEFMSEPLCDIECHWGLTYSRNYLVGQDDKDTWWIGFDCAHCTDLNDYETALKYFKDKKSQEYIKNSQNLDNEVRTNVDMYGYDISIKSLGYVMENCIEIVDQIC